MNKNRLRTLLAEEGFKLAAPRMRRKKIKTWSGEEVALLTQAQSGILSLLPGGKDRGYDVRKRDGVLLGGAWRKSGGYIDRIERKFWEGVKKLGIQRKDRTETGSPDGSYVGSGWVGQDSEGNTVRFSRSIGVTARQNRYSIKVEFKKPAPLEGDEAAEARERVSREELSQQVVRDTLPTIRGFKFKEGASFGAALWASPIPRRYLPPWADPRGNHTVVVDPRRIEVRAFANPEGGGNTHAPSLKYDPTRPDTLLRAIKDVLSALKRMEPDPDALVF